MPPHGTRIQCARRPLTSYLIIHQDQTVRNQPRPSRYAAKEVKYAAPSLGLCELPVTFLSLSDARTLVRFVPVPDDVEQVTEHLGHIGDVAVA